MANSQDVYSQVCIELEEEWANYQRELGKLAEAEWHTQSLQDALEELVWRCCSEDCSTTEERAWLAERLEANPFGQEAMLLATWAIGALKLQLGFMVVSEEDLPF